MTEKIEIGEFRNELARDLQQNLGRIIDRYSKEEPYWLLVFATNIGKDIQTKIMRLSLCPPKMLGTICYYVDNKKCELRRLWVLPLDIPRDPDIIDLDKGLEEIAKSAKAQVIVY